MSGSLFKNIVVSDYGLIDTNISLEDELLELSEMFNQSTQPVNQAIDALGRSQYLLAGLESSDREPSENEVELIEFSLESIHAQLRCAEINGFDAISLEEDGSIGKTKEMIGKAWKYLITTLKRILEWIKTKFKKFKSLFSIRQKKIDKNLTASSANVKKSKGGKSGEGKFDGYPTDIAPWKTLYELFDKAESKAHFAEMFPGSIAAGYGNYTMDESFNLRLATFDPMVHSYHPLTEETLGKFQAITDLGKVQEEKFEKSLGELEHKITVLLRSGYVDAEHEKGRELEYKRLYAKSSLMHSGVLLSNSIQGQIDYAIRQFDKQFLQQEPKP